MNELMIKEQTEIVTQTAQATAEAMMTALAPMMQAMSQMSAAMTAMAQQTKAMQENMNALQKTLMRSMPLTRTQEKFINAAIKEKAIATKTEYGLPDEGKKELQREIRKKLMRRWGVSSIRELPESEYEIMLNTIRNFDESAIVEKYL